MARRLPGAVQPFLTWLTALPTSDGGRGRRKPMHHIAEACALLAGGTALSAAAVIEGGGLLALLPVGWVATTSGMGLLQAVIYHHCAHGTVLAKRRANRALGRFISMLLLIKDFDLYQKQHIAHHSPKRLLTDEDEFLDYLRRFIGIRPGMPRAESWRRVIGSFFSPLFHARLLGARCIGCFAACGTLDRAARLVFWGALLGSSWWIGALAPLLVAWFVPAVFLLQIATTLRVLAEHRSTGGDPAARRDRGFIARTTAGVFPGVALPRTAGGRSAALGAWARWWLEMMTVHFFSRVLVLVGDAPAHDYHHRRPGSRDWASHIQARSRDRGLGCPGYPVNYAGTLGLIRAIDENLASLASAGHEPRAAEMGPPRLGLGARSGWLRGGLAATGPQQKH